jgi:hypothetical protein
LANRSAAGLPWTRTRRSGHLRPPTHTAPLGRRYFHSRCHRNPCGSDWVRKGITTDSSDSRNPEIGRLQRRTCPGRRRLIPVLRSIWPSPASWSTSPRSNSTFVRKDWCSGISDAAFLSGKIGPLEAERFADLANRIWVEFVARTDQRSLRSPPLAVDRHSSVTSRKHYGS